MNPSPLQVVVMGVAGCGKTAVGEALARSPNAAFIEGDALHPPENVALMRQGTPLNDAQREGWLDAVARGLAEAGGPAVAACSALKRTYRDRLRRACPRAVFLYLELDRRTAAERVARRRNHFMPASLVESQFSILEPPGADESAVTVDARDTFEEVVTQALVELRALTGQAR